MIDFTFSDTLTPRLEAAQKAAEDFTPAMAAIGAYMETATRQRFEDQAGPDGKPWLPSARVKEHGGQTLVKSARMLGSLVHGEDATTAFVGTNVIYAPPHQFGAIIHGKTLPDRTTRPLRTPFGPRASVTIPARPFLGFSDADEIEIEAILTDHLAHGFEGATA